MFALLSIIYALALTTATPRALAAPAEYACEPVMMSVWNIFNTDYAQYNQYGYEYMGVGESGMFKVDCATAITINQYDDSGNLNVQQKCELTGQPYNINGDPYSREYATFFSIGCSIGSNLTCFGPDLY